MNLSVCECLRNRALSQPDAPCISDQKRSLSYLECWRYVCGFADWLRAEGLNPGDCVVCVNEQSVEHIVADLAVELAGGVFVPLENRISAEREQAIIEETSARFAIRARDTESNSNIRCLPPEEALRHPHPDPLGCDPLWPEPHHRSIILFTTGTTGQSKGVMFTHQNAIASAAQSAELLGMRPGETWLILTPINHVLGMRRYQAAIANGCSVALLPGTLFPDRLFDVILASDVRCVVMVPAIVRQLFQRTGDRIARHAHQLRCIEMGSSVLPDADRDHLMALLPCTRIHNQYGSTEAGIASGIEYSCRQYPPDSLGRPPSGVDVAFMDEHGNLFQATRENPGLIAWRGPMLMAGYLNAPELTKRVLRHGYFCSNDLGYADGDGNLYLLGRADDIINVGGFKVAPQDVERQVLLFPDVLECACVSMPDPDLGQAPLLCVVMKGGVECPKKELLRFLKPRLLPLMMPRRIDQLDSLPQTYNGKLDRKKLAERQAAQR